MDAVIVGAGFGGMGAAIQLDRLGIHDYVILDREDDLGGTWHVNRYPGLAVDIASVTYSYSFEPNPNWSRLFAPGAELKRYAEHVADKYDLRRRMRFGTTVTGAGWDADAGRWRVALADGDPISARFLITATGFLSQPKSPDIPGIDGFAGKVIHSADWDHAYPLAGKHTATIGTGATAVQLIPELADEVAELTVYQRTPIWVVPKIDARIPRPVRRLFAALPATQRMARGINSAALEALTIVGVLHYRHTQLGNRLAELAARAHLRSRSATRAPAANSLRPTPSAANGRRSPTRTTARSTNPTCTWKPARSTASNPTRSSPSTAAGPRSTCSCSPPDSTSGKPTSLPSPSSAATAATSACGGGRTGSRRTRA